MKISNETKIGALTIIGLGIIICGFYFLKGRNLFSKQNTIYALFNNIGPLDKASLVKINGATIGSIYDISPLDRKVNQVKVTILLTKDVDIPTNSVAYINASVAGIGFSTLTIEKGDATTYLKNGGQIASKAIPDMLANITNAIPTTILKIQTTLDTLNQVFGHVSKLISSETSNKINNILKNVETTTASLDATIKKVTVPATASLQDIQEITAGLKKNNENIQTIITNTKQFSEKLSQIELNKLTTTVENTLNQLKTTIQQFTNPQNSLGALLTDKTLYNQINKTTLGLEILLDDLRKNPKRYVNVSVFGKKDKSTPLMAPLQKDTTPIK